MQAARAGLREAESEAGGPRRFSPVVLKIAAEEGIDLSRVPGTGIGGRVSKRDLQRYLDSLRKGGTPAAASRSRRPTELRRASRVLRRLLPRRRNRQRNRGRGSSLPSISRSKAISSSRSRGGANLSPSTWCTRRRIRRTLAPSRKSTSPMRCVCARSIKMSSHAAKDSISRSCRSQPRRRFARSRNFRG